MLSLTQQELLIGEAIILSELKNIEEMDIKLFI